MNWPLLKELIVGALVILIAYAIGYSHGRDDERFHRS